MNIRKRKICFVITSFIHYSRNLLILEELKKRPDVELHILIGGAAMLTKYSSKYAHIKEVLAKDGFSMLHEVYFNIEGDSIVSKAKTVGLGIIEFASVLERISPDLLVVRGDRFEVLAAAVAASNMNIPIAHIEGGDLTGSIDESVRHSITKLAHIHFVTNEPAKNRVIRMGESKNYVFNFGSPDIEVAHRLTANAKNSGQNFTDIQQTGSGANINPRNDFLMVMYHPVTTEIHKLTQTTRNLIKAINAINMPTFWFWPNFDTGAEKISHELRVFNDKSKNHKIRFMRYVPPKDFLLLLKSAKCLVGNSSSGIKECSYFGTPVVDISSRQNRRLRSDNVLYSKSDAENVKKSIMAQVAKVRYPESRIYYSVNTAKRIARKLATARLYIQKKFHE